MMRRVNSAKHNYRNLRVASPFSSRPPSSRPPDSTATMPKVNGLKAESSQRVKFEETKAVDLERDQDPEEKRGIRREYRKIQEGECCSPFMMRQHCLYNVL